MDRGVSNISYFGSNIVPDASTTSVVYSMAAALEVEIIRCSVTTPRMSTVAGIRHLSYTIASNDGDTLEGVKRYNGHGNSAYVWNVFEKYKRGINPDEKYNWGAYEPEE